VIDSLTQYLYNPLSMVPGHDHRTPRQGEAYMSKPMNPEDRLIFALDVPDIDQAQGYVRMLEDVVRFYKVGWELFTDAGMNIVRFLKGRGLKVFLDLKFPEDVDETIHRYIQVIVREKIDFITLHGNGRIFRIAKQAKGDSSLKILSLTLLSSLDETDMRDNYMVSNGSEYSFPFSTAEHYVNWRAEQSRKAGCDGFIASGRFVKMIRDNFKDDHPIIVTPGVRPSGASSNEHKNVLTPREAILSGSDYLVVGRPIRDAVSAKEKAEEIIKEIELAEKEKLSTV